MVYLLSLEKMDLDDNSELQLKIKEYMKESSEEYEDTKVGFNGLCQGYRRWKTRFCLDSFDCNFKQVKRFKNLSDMVK